MGIVYITIIIKVQELSCGENQPAHVSVQDSI